jgi:hypothetical protein
MQLLKIIFFLFITSYSYSQINTTQKNNEYVIIEGDTINMLRDTVHLSEVKIFRYKMDDEAKKQFLLLQNRVLKVYPYAKIASERLKTLNLTLSKLSNTRDKKKYQKIIENYLETEFKEQLKKLSKKQGQVLVKLIYRQTGETTYDLIKEYKSGWKAFWSNNTARLFDINLKLSYDPFEVNEDYLIEVILQRAFLNGRLKEQKSNVDYNINDLNLHWEKVSSNLNKK